MPTPFELANFETPIQPETHVKSVIRFHHPFTMEERLSAATKAGWNVFQFPAEMLQGGDLLSDSGTTTMTAEQFAAMFLADESYGSNWGYFQLVEQTVKTFGLDADKWKLFLFHQGRAAEHALFSQMKGRDAVIPSNNFFDTTRANAEANGITALDLVDTSHNEDPEHPFKGNIDLNKLEALLLRDHERIPFVLITITNNTGGGQPVALKNLRAAKALCSKFKTPFFLDACRFAENAWLNKLRDPELSDMSVEQIVHEQFMLADGFTMSFKKDGLANMGGMLGLKLGTNLEKMFPDILERITDHEILVEGHPTYGGMSGRDIMSIVEGLKTVTQEIYLKGRIEQVAQFGGLLHSLGVPVVRPFGGHAVYIDIDKFFADTKLTRADFGGISLTANLLLKGVRLCELGAFAFGTYDPITGKESFPAHNFVRAAVPRNKYSDRDLAYVAHCVHAYYEQRHDLPRAVPVYGHEKALRHMKARFELRGG